MLRGVLLSSALLWATTRALPAAAAPAHAQVESASEGAPPDARTRRPLAVAAAAVPGVLVHGSGQLVLGRPAVARKLLWIEAAGLPMFVGGGATLFVTGASRYLVAPAAGMTIAGFGLFSTSYLADLYGAAADETGAALSRYRPPALWQTELGYRYVYDPQFAYRHFLVQRVTRQIGDVRLSPHAWFSTRGDSARYRLEASYRLLGASDPRVTLDGSFIESSLALTHQPHQPEGFRKTLAELSFDTRYDLARLGAALRGAFIELGAGYAIGRIDYDLLGTNIASDIEHLLLSRFGFGVMLRGAAAPGSEALLYYDHRHDDYAAGLKLTGLGSGVAGHFGASVRWFFGSELGAAADFQVGSAYVAGMSILYRHGFAR